MDTRLVDLVDLFQLILVSHLGISINHLIVYYFLFLKLALYEMTCICTVIIIKPLGNTKAFSFFFLLLYKMPITTFNNKIEFKSNLEAVQSDEPIDYTEKLINAIDVQYLDTDIYMSKELWLPVGSRGAFGGQIVGQALHAGWNTVSDELFVHVRERTACLFVFI